MAPPTPAGGLDERIARLIAARDAEHLEVWSTETRGGSTRFANSAITQNIAKRDHTVDIRAAYGQKVGSAATNDLSETSLEATLRRAEAVARASEEDSEYLPPLGPQSYPEIVGADPAVAEQTPEERALAIGEALALGRERGAEGFGSYTTSVVTDRGWTSNGLEFEHDRTFLLYANTFKGPATTGWAKRASHAVAGLDTRDAAECAIDKATRFDTVEDLEPGAYTVVLEPAAFADLIAWVQWTVDAKQTDEGRSAWQGKVGTKVASELISCRSLPLRAGLPGYPATEGGLAAPEVTWIDRGVLKTLAYSRFWAEKCGVAPTGWPGNFVVSCDVPGHGTKTVEELVAGVERGVLVTRFWYLNFVDEMTLTITGMTRDGLFRIQDGEVVGALRNTRFNDSPLSFLQRVTEVGQPAVAVGEWDDALLCPPVRLEEFHFTAGTSF